jgi:putative PIN family toxin of toxin-antitoxin system
MDTSVLVSAFRSARGASYQLLLLALDGVLILVATPALFLEYEDVLSRPEQMAVHGFSLHEIDSILQDLATVIEPVKVHFQWRPQLIDADDELVLEAAINGRADIATHNVKDFAGVERRFAVRVKRPAEILKEIKR